MNMTPDQDPNHPLVPPQPGVDRDIPVHLGGDTHGVMKESELIRISGVHEDDNELTHWVQYHLPKNGQQVHRSAWVQLKKPLPPLFADAGSFA